MYLWTGKPQDYSRSSVMQTPPSSCQSSELLPGDESSTETACKVEDVKKNPILIVKHAGGKKGGFFSYHQNYKGERKTTATFHAHVARCMQSVCNTNLSACTRFRSENSCKLTNAFSISRCFSSLCEYEEQEEMKDTCNTDSPKDSRFDMLG